MGERLLTFSEFLQQEPALPRPRRPVSIVEYLRQTCTPEEFAEIQARASEISPSCSSCSSDDEECEELTPEEKKEILDNSKRH